MSERRGLPKERSALVHRFVVGGAEGYLCVGLYDDGTPGEVFLTMAKEGSTLSGMIDTIASLVSLALQRGVPLETLVKKFRDTRFEPSGYTENDEIPNASSIVDYVFRWLELRYLVVSD